MNTHGTRLIPATQTGASNRRRRTTTASATTCILNSVLAIQSSALAVMAVRHQNICCSPAPLCEQESEHLLQSCPPLRAGIRTSAAVLPPSASRSGRKSGQTTLPYPASYAAALRTCDVLPPSSKKLEFPSYEREEEEDKLGLCRSCVERWEHSTTSV